MKEIKLTKGYYAQVDDEDFELLSRFKWHVSVQPYTCYATTSINSRGVRMHNMIMYPHEGLVVDHLDYNGLNNQKSNLEICTNSENNRRRRPWKWHRPRSRRMT